MSLPTKFLAQRRERLVIARAREFLGSSEIIPDMPHWPGLYEPKGDTINHDLAAMEAQRDATGLGRRGTRYIPDVTKPPALRLGTMVRKAASLLAEIKTAHLVTIFTTKRQQYYSCCSAARSYAKANRLPVPELPSAPESHFPGARPRGRWLS
jgi:hypothetical protein